MNSALTSEILLAERKDFRKRFWRMLIVIALQNVIVYGVNLLDNVMIGGYTELALHHPQGLLIVPVCFPGVQQMSDLIHQIFHICFLFSAQCLCIAMFFKILEAKLMSFDAVQFPV